MHKKDCSVSTSLSIISMVLDSIIPHNSILKTGFSNKCRV